MRRNKESKMPSKFLEKAPVSLIAEGGLTFTTYHDLFCLTLSVYRGSRGLRLINAEKEYPSKASDTELRSAGIPLITNHTSQPSATGVS
jgi:hypothetical protein